MIELKDFIAETLVGILEGVNGAKTRMPDEAAKIAPYGSFESSGGSSHYNFSDMHVRIGLVDFDVAVTTLDKKSEEVSGKAQAKIMVLSGDLKGTEQKELSYQNVTRIKFSVPIALFKSPKDK